jgi:hypothetical protein
MGFSGTGNEIFPDNPKESPVCNTVPLSWTYESRFFPGNSIVLYRILGIPELKAEIYGQLTFFIDQLHWEINLVFWIVKIPEVKAGNRLTESRHGSGDVQPHEEATFWHFC